MKIVVHETEIDWAPAMGTVVITTTLPTEVSTIYWPETGAQVRLDDQGNLIDYTLGTQGTRNFIVTRQGKILARSEIYR